MWETPGPAYAGSHLRILAELRGELLGWLSPAVLSGPGGEGLQGADSLVFMCPPAQSVQMQAIMNMHVNRCISFEKISSSPHVEIHEGACLQPAVVRRAQKLRGCHLICPQFCAQGKMLKPSLCSNMWDNKKSLNILCGNNLNDLSLLS